MSTIFTIKPATRKETPALIALWGPSSSGKTYSALELARGLVGPKGKIGIIDTENGRSEFYADRVGGWDHLDFQPPFTPARYVHALETFQASGDYGCIIVDSMSHVWEGLGGILEMADKNTSKALNKWAGPKSKYKTMMQNLLRSPTHVIFCLRAKEGVLQTGSGSDMKITSTGLEPICEKNFIYEMNISVLIGPDHKPLFTAIDRFSCNPIIPVVKIPDEIKDIIKPGEFLSVSIGEQITKWISGGEAYNAEFKRLEVIARDVASMGTESLEKHWTGITKEERIILADILPELKSIATEADDDAVLDEADEADEAPTDTEITDSLDDPDSLASDEVSHETDSADDAQTDKPEEKPAEQPGEVKHVFRVMLKLGATKDCANIAEWGSSMRDELATFKDAASIENFRKRHVAVVGKLDPNFHNEVMQIGKEIDKAAMEFKPKTETT